jgi:hypothetical protein
MPQEFLDGANIVASFEQMRGKCMPEGMAARRFLGQDHRELPRLFGTSDFVKPPDLLPEHLLVQKRVGT